MIALLPCPFCGNRLPRRADDGSEYEFRYHIECSGVEEPFCGASTDVYLSADAAAEGWNRRSPPAPAAPPMPASLLEVVQAVVDRQDDVDATLCTINDLRVALEAEREARKEAPE